MVIPPLKDSKTKKDREGQNSNEKKYDFKSSLKKAAVNIQEKAKETVCETSGYTRTAMPAWYAYKTRDYVR